MQAGTAVQLRSVRGSWIIIHQELRQQHYGIKPQRSGDLAARWARFAKCRNLDIISQFAWNQILSAGVASWCLFNVWKFNFRKARAWNQRAWTRNLSLKCYLLLRIYTIWCWIGPFYWPRLENKWQKTKKKTQQQMYQWLPWKGGAVISNELCFFLLLLLKRADCEIAVMWSYVTNSAFSK